MCNSFIVTHVTTNPTALLLSVPDMNSGGDNHVRISLYRDITAIVRLGIVLALH
jgi:hypothetical protein